MPEIFDCKVEGSVGRALHQGWQEVLPREIRENPQARWVLEFDSLGHPKESREFERQNFGPGDFHNRLNWIVRRVLTPAVEQQTQFYFAALFRIGRQWRISELAIGSLSTVLESKVSPRLVRPSREPLSSVGVDQARLSALLASPPDVLFGALRILFEEALNYHRGILRQTQSWWRNWDAEVRDVRSRVSTTSELLQSYANRGLS